MFKPLGVLMVSVLVLTSCATVRESRINPLNWFGGARSEPVQTTATGAQNPLIPARRRNVLSILTNRTEADYGGVPIAEVSELLVERRPGGAIVRATGIADTVGPFDVRLIPVPAESDAGTLTFSLRALQQRGPRNVGANARMVTVAAFLTDQELEGIRTIRVSGRSNAQVTRR